MIRDPYGLVPEDYSDPEYEAWLDKLVRQLCADSEKLDDDDDSADVRPRRGRPADGLARAARIFEDVTVIRFSENVGVTEAARRYAQRSGMTINHVLKAHADIEHPGDGPLNAALDRVEERLYGVADGRLGRWERCRPADWYTAAPSEPVQEPSTTLAQSSASWCDSEHRVVAASPDLEKVLVEVLKSRGKI